MTERSWWGWGTTDRALTDDECVAPPPPLPGLPGPPPPGTDGAGRCAGAADRCPVVAAALHRARGAGVAHLRQGLPGRRPRAGGRPGQRSRRGRAPVDRGRRRAACSTGPARRASPSSPTAAAARSSAASSTAASGPWLSLDLTALDRVLEVDPVEPGGPHPGRRARPGPRGPAAPARPDAAALPAELRVLHARRLARHPRRRPLRDRATRTSTTWSSRCAWSRRPGVSESRRLPGSGAGPVAGPAVPRLGGHARRHHRGVDAAAGPAAVQGVGVGARSRTSTAAAAAVRAIAQAGLYPANCRLLDPRRGGAGRRRSTARRPACSASSRPTHPVDGAARRAGRSSARDARRHAAEPAAPGRTRPPPATWRSAFLRMPYLRDGAGAGWASSSRRSRPPAPGTAFADAARRRSTERRRARSSR